MMIYRYLATGVLGVLFLCGCTSVNSRDYYARRADGTNLMDVEWATALPTPDRPEEDAPAAPSTRHDERRSYAELQTGRLAPEVVPNLPPLEDKEIWRPEIGDRPVLDLRGAPQPPQLPALTDVPDISSAPR